MSEDILIPLIIFSFILCLVWMIISYRKWKLTHTQGRRQDADNSMGLSELKSLMREAVEDANEPLVERIEALEAALRRAEAPRLMPAERGAFLEEVNETSLKEAEPATRRA